MVGYSNMVRWSVRRDGEEIERVSYLRTMSAEDVKKSLVEHDGYDEGIEVVRADFAAASEYSHLYH